MQKKRPELGAITYGLMLSLSVIERGLYVN